MSKKLQEILRKNIEFEKESPYNFCDRWCERCVHEKQMRCALYKDKLECKITCIAYGKDEDDPEITEAVMEAQYKEIEEKLSGHIDKFGIDLDNPDIDEEGLNEEDAVNFEDLPEDIQKHIRFAENNPLDATAKRYLEMTHAFLEKTYYSNKKIDLELKNDFEVVSWYHTLLPAKLHRALAGFHEPMSEDDISLYDAVAQFQICRKAIKCSARALQNIAKKDKTLQSAVTQLSALLYNILSRIEFMEEEI